MFLAVQIKEACNEPKHLNPVAVYDTYVGKSTEETKRNSLVSNDGSLLCHHLRNCTHIYSSVFHLCGVSISS